MNATGILNIEKERKKFPVLKDWAYFETAGTGLIPDYIYDAVKKYQDGRYLVGGDSNWSGRSTLEMINDTKRSLAAMISCNPEEIAFGSNCSQMYTLFTQGIEIRPGDNVVLTEGGWIGLRYAWQLYEPLGLEVRYALKNPDGSITGKQICDLVDDRTIAVAVSLVESATGYRHSVKEIGTFCRSRGIPFTVDAAQAAGVMPIDVNEMSIDFLVGNDYKWMLHYCGTGYAYIRKELQEKLIQRSAGWMSDRDLFNTAKDHLELREDAGRFELGYPNAAGIHALELSSGTYLRLGAQNIADYVLDLIEYLQSQVETVPGVKTIGRFSRVNLSAITNIAIDDTLSIDNDVLKENRIFAHLRDGQAHSAKYLSRLSLHYYNNREDIDRLTTVLRDCVR